MTEKDFDPKTMKRATFADIDRMMVRLWGSGAREQFRTVTFYEDGEPLDLTQTATILQCSNC